MLSHSFFSIFLHLVINSGIDTQAIFIQVILGSVRFLVLGQPAIEAVICPEQRIRRIVLGVGITRFHRLLRVHHTTEHVSEIRSKTGIVVLNLI